MSLWSEIHEQPVVLRHLLDTQMDVACQIAATIRQRHISYVFVAARGSSDNAAIYAKYLWGAFARLPVALAAPSLFTLYDQPPRLQDALVVGISQSGQSPDIVKVLVEGRRQGAPTVALTNDVRSPLGIAADYVLDISAGQERAIAATKTYTASLMAIAMLSAALTDGIAQTEVLAGVPDAVQEALRLGEAIKEGVQPFRGVTRCVVLGRGYNYATAFEWALKMKELAYVVAEPYSPADFRHGPIAMVEPGFPILAIAPRGQVSPDMLDLLKTLASRLGSELVVVSDDEEALACARLPLPLPGQLPEWATPLVSIVPAQLFCYHLTQAKGLDPESPRGLTKVTETY
jgi:glucosamine--fructose-6-phosphate aminotransferase (isomerizing)